jgi:tRNA A37 threonylcarbamoyladenosine dehydratase
MQQVDSQQFAAMASMARLYGPLAPAKLASAHVVILGLGGVGSWAAEALARCGVGQLTLVDPDDICVSNIGRQIHTLQSTIGQSKVNAMAKRLIDINPNIKINAIADFFDLETSVKILTEHGEIDFVFDAIDRLKNKLVVIDYCRNHHIPFLISGAAGGKDNPWDVKIDDLSRTCYDPLLLRLRKRLRRHNLAPRGKKSMGINCIFSTSPMIYTNSSGELCSVKESGSIPKLDCHQGLGVAGHVTGTFGLFAAAFAVKNILSSK